MQRITGIFIIFFLFINIYSDTIILKDDQIFEADVLSFDSYYLVLKLQNNQEISIPWDEIKQIKHTTTSKNWMEDVYITPDDVEVTTLVAPLSTEIAFKKALFPGLLIHGSGHFYAKDYNTGYMLLSAEIVSLVLMSISFFEIISPVEKDQSFNVTKIIFFSGAAIFGGTWLYDLIFSSRAVEKYNQENKDKFLIKEDKKNENSTGQ
ncbi:MAG: hypothetical protein N3E50_08750 [Candidatus Goldbacteria bacterium]|nr:hypothetical protein [Candidatus Goldiibacteriota bacterium]